MKRWLRIANRGAVTLAAVLCVAASTPLAAQQSSGAAPRGPAATADSATAVQAGPRLRPEWRPVTPAFADSSASGSVAAAASHTITVTTLVLVLAVIIAVLLIA